MNEKNKILPQHQGLHSNRLNVDINHLEFIFADEWQKINNNSKTLEWILTTKLQPEAVSERDRIIANTIIQWLGTPIGQGFLKNVMYRYTTTTRQELNSL